MNLLLCGINQHISHGDQGETWESLIVNVLAELNQKSRHTKNCVATLVQVLDGETITCIPGKMSTTVVGVESECGT